MQLSQTSLATDANLVSYYKLEDLLDETANNHDLTNNNTVTFTPARYILGANFGASNSNKSLTINDNLGITGGNISISCWVKLLAEIGSGGWVFVAQSGTGANNWIRYHLGYTYNGGTQQVTFTRVKNDVAAQSTTYTITLGTTNWYHLVFTYDGTNMRGYLNGALVAGPTAASGSGGTANGHTEFSIGASPDGSNTAGAVENFASVLVDDVAIFNDVLSLTEVQTIFNESGGSFLLNMI